LDCDYKDNFPRTPHHASLKPHHPSVSPATHFSPADKPFKHFHCQRISEKIPVILLDIISFPSDKSPMAEEMFRPPVNRAMRVLDRSFFQKKIPVSAARVVDNKTISKCRSELFRSKDVLRLERYQIVRPDPNEADAKAGKKCIVLRPQVDDKGEPS
jgi:hypothetical protein